MGLMEGDVEIACDAFVERWWQFVTFSSGISENLHDLRYSSRRSGRGAETILGPSRYASWAWSSVMLSRHPCQKICETGLLLFPYTYKSGDMKK